MKKVPALIAAFVTTLVVGVLMGVMAFNALLNPNTVQAADSPDQPAQVQALPQVTATGDSAAQVKQLQDLVSQYQAREKQYQSQLNQARQRLEQANTQIQQAQGAVQQVKQYQSLLDQLQQMGVIQIDGSGQVTVPRFRGFEEHGSFGDGD